MVIGRVAMERISAIEGIRLSPEMKRDLRRFDKQGLSSEARREAILKKYGKGSA
jgi:hypothetical protein